MKKTILITKEEFVKIMENIEEQSQRLRDFDAALSKMCDGYPVFDTDDKYLESLLFLLVRVFGEDDLQDFDTIEWYLYDSGDDKTLYYDDYVLQINSLEELYNYLCAEYDFRINHIENALIDYFRLKGTRAEK